MPRSGFYNQNLYRDYPFQSQGEPLEQLRSRSSESMPSTASYATAALPHEVIVDFGCIMGLDGQYDDRLDWVYLYRISRSSDFFTFEFRTTANSQVLTFIRRDADPEYTYEWSEAAVQSAAIEYPIATSPSSASTPSSEGNWWYGCDAKPAWEGFLITGKFDELKDLIPVGEARYFESVYQVIEPTRIQNLKGGFVRSINLANRARTQATLAEECLIARDASGSSISQDSVAQDVTIYEVAACIQRAVTFTEGFNCRIRQEDTTNTLIIGAGVGYGDGEVCEEYPFYPGESLGIDAYFYTGGPTCSEILTTINGKGGSRIRFDAGPGFNVRTTVEDPSTIIVDMTLEDFAICLDPAEGA